MTFTKPGRLTSAQPSMRTLSSSPSAAARTASPEVAPGNFLGFALAYDTRPLTFGRNVLPSGSGTSTMSRGTDTIDTAPAAGSSEATIIVSVRNSDRPGPESTPSRSTVNRLVSGGGLGAIDSVGPSPKSSSWYVGWNGSGRHG